MTQAAFLTVESADGTSIYVQTAGLSSNPALVCIHGFASTSFAFSKQFADAKVLERVYLVAYDVRGNGRSGLPVSEDSYRGQRHAEDFRAVCEALEIVRPVVLGW